MRLGPFRPDELKPLVSLLLDGGASFEVVPAAGSEGSTAFPTIGMEQGPSRAAYVEIRDEDFDRLEEEMHKVMRAVVPMHRTLQDEGQIEVTTTPFFHPILPLLIDTDQATVDRPGASLPRRFAYPEDAALQLQRAVDHYKSVFRRRPRGMWPAEGAVSQAAIALFGRGRVRWIATPHGHRAQG